MLPSKEHTFILQTVNTYYHGYVTSQYDITHCRACWRQILPINTWYYQSALMPFIEHSALLLLEIQDPQLFECIFEVGFCVREGVKLCIAKEMEEQWRTGFQGEEQNLANTQKRQGLCLEGLTVSGQQNSVYQTSEDGSGREEGGGKGGVISTGVYPGEQLFCIVLCQQIAEVGEVSISWAAWTGGSKKQCRGT